MVYLSGDFLFLGAKKMGSTLCTPVHLLGILKSNALELNLCFFYFHELQEHYAAFSSFGSSAGGGRIRPEPWPCCP